MMKLITLNGVIDPVSLATIRDRADMDCPRCHGKGVSGFRNRGGTAVICKCVETILKLEAEEELKNKPPLPPIQGNPSPEATHG